MHHLSTEHRHVSERNLAEDIARHICRYQIYGEGVVVAREPAKLLAGIKTAWLNLKRDMRQEIATSTDQERKALLTNQLMYMQNCSFTTTPPIEDPTEKIIVTTIERLIEYAPLCQTMYAACGVSQQDIHRATSWMPPYGLVVIYDIEKGRV